MQPGVRAVLQMYQGVQLSGITRCLRYMQNEGLDGTSNVVIMGMKVSMHQ